MSANTNHTAASNRSRGFTVVELTISITVLGLIAVGMLWAFANYLSIITRNAVLASMTSDSQNLLRGTVEELRYGAGVRQTNAITDANGPTGGWNTSNSNFVIIIAIPAVDVNNEYIIDSSTGEPYNNEYVYFKDDTTLYKRVLANPSAVGNSATTTCPAGTGSPSCPIDRELLNTIDDMVFTLYDQDNTATTDPLLARSVKIDLSLMKDTFGAPLVLDYSIQTTLRNTF